MTKHKSDDIVRQALTASPVDTTYIAGRWHHKRLNWRGFRTEAKVLAKSLTITPNIGVKKFLVISRARSGTTLLSDLLDHHPDVQCDTEVLRNNMLSPATHLDLLARRSPATAYGAKILSYQMVQIHRMRDPVGFLTNLTGKGFSFIHLERDTFAQTLSLTLAQKSNNFHSRKARANREKITLDVEDFIGSLEWNDLLLRYERFCLQDIPHLHLSYETDLLSPEAQAATTNRIFDWIGVPPYQVTSDLKKMLPKDPSNILANYDTIVQTLQNKGLGHLVPSSAPA